ncbi:MAG: alanyl-tRNA editing protein [Defluviitoga tunisiensis]|jgi:alanyl-tRNA synthetase|nr:alanyl-tRNA editing protein [Defluviitoga tunisiensis]
MILQGKIEIIEVKKEKQYYFAKINHSPFYPDGKGGQIGDRGFVGEAKIVEVRDDGLLLDREINIGEHAFEIDEDRRFEISQQHTAQHILSAAFEKIADLKTVGFKMGEEHSTIDLNGIDIDEKIFSEAENLSNKIIAECIIVEEITTSKEEANHFTLRKPLSEKVEGPVRIIKIGEFDESACGGFHVKNTGNINLLKIINTEKVKGNLTRIYFVAGKRALQDYSLKHNLIEKLSLKLTSGISQLDEKIEILIQENKEYKNKIKKICEYAAPFIVNEIIKTPLIVKEHKIIYYKKENDIADFISNLIDLNEYTLIVEDQENSTFIIFSKKINCKEFINRLKEKYDIKGGGSEVRGNIKGKISLDQIIDNLK